MSIWTALVKDYVGKVGRLPRFTPLRRLTVQKLLGQVLPGQLGGGLAGKLLRELRQAGLGVRTQWYYKQVRHYREADNLFTLQRETALDELLRTEEMPIAPFHSSTEYMYQVSMDVMGYTEDSPTDDRDEDEWGTQPYYFGSDELMTPNQVVAAFEAKFRSTSMKEVVADWNTLSFVRAMQRGVDI